MRSCRYLGIDFCQAHGIAYSPIVEAWAAIAEQAEQEAENELIERAQKKAQRG